MMVIDSRRQLPALVGEGQYPRADGVHMAPDDTMFLTDDGGRFVPKVTLDGKVLLELGCPERTVQIAERRHRRGAISISSTISAAAPMAGSMSLIARTICASVRRHRQVRNAMAELTSSLGDPHALRQRPIFYLGEIAPATRRGQPRIPNRGPAS